MWFRRLGFRTDLLLSSAVVLVLFLVGRAAGQVATTLEPHRFLMSFRDAHLRYEREFGACPAFRGGLHGGVVTAGGLGDVKQQIVFTGDILNTAARLEEYAKRAGFDLVASGAVLERLTLPAGIRATPCGDLARRGKEASVAAYGLTRADRSA